MGKKLTQPLKTIKHTLTTNTKHVVEKLNGALADIFYDDKLKDIAKETNFVQRSSSRLKGNEIIQSMVMASIDPKSTPLSGISDNLRVINNEAEMSLCALRQRLNTSKAVAFFQKVYAHAIESKLKPLSDELNLTCDKFNKGALQYFSKVLLHDSSSCTLNEILAKNFKGSSGNASKSLVKIDVIHDLKANKIEEAIITDVTQPDQSLSKKILKHISKDVLVIQDLGYFEVETFNNISDLGGFYLSRLLPKVLVYLNQEDKEPIEIGKHLLMLKEKGESLDIEVFITKKKMKTRLVAYPVPKRVFKQRLKEYKKKHKRKIIPAGVIAQQYFTILITNVPKEIWPWSIVGTVYKIRWQIELIFKVWKSQFSIEYLKGTKPQRIYCLIYARLLTVALLFAIYNLIERLVTPFGLELSMTKLANWLKRNGRFISLILKGFTSDSWNLLIAELDLLCKDNWQRNRKTTQEYIEECIPFLETFKECA